MKNKRRKNIFIPDALCLKLEIKAVKERKSFTRLVEEILTASVSK